MALAFVSVKGNGMGIRIYIGNGSMIGQNNTGHLMMIGEHGDASCDKNFPVMLIKYFGTPSDNGSTPKKINGIGFSTRHPEVSTPKILTTSTDGKDIQR